jgi:hypothetical protein
MKLYVVEWKPTDDSYLVGIFTSEAGARAAFDAFVDPEDRFGWVYLIRATRWCSSASLALSPQSIDG